MNISLTTLFESLTSSYFITICAWCRKILKIQLIKPGGVSHGICDKCFRKELCKIETLEKHNNKQ